MPTLQPPYLIDSNIFVEAARRYYPLDFARPFWDGLLRFAEEGKIISIDKVLDELNRGNDEMKDWAATHFSPYFKTTQTPEVLAKYIELIKHCQKQNQYHQSAKDTFMESANADTWVLAYAQQHGCIIVTHELPDPHIKRNVPIPNICRDLNLPYCNTFEMLRELGFRF